MAKLLQGADLLKKAEALGVNVYTPPKDNLGSLLGTPSEAAEHELQTRVMNAENHLRQDKLWKVALVSAFASVASAVAAFLAVLWHR